MPKKYTLKNIVKETWNELEDSKLITIPKHGLETIFYWYFVPTVFRRIYQRHDPGTLRGYLEDIKTGNEFVDELHNEETLAPIFEENLAKFFGGGLPYLAITLTAAHYVVDLNPLAYAILSAIATNTISGAYETIRKVKKRLDENC